MLSGSGKPRIVTPAPMPPLTGLLAWFDPSTGVSVSGGLASDWTSREGATNTVSKTGTNRPSFNATGLLGLPCLTFASASSQILEGAANLAAAIDGTANYSIFLVASLSGNLAQTFCGASNSGTAGRLKIAGAFRSSSITRPSQTQADSGGSFTQFAGASLAMSLSTPYRIGYTYANTGSIKFRLSGVELSSSITASNPTCNTFSIGGQNNGGTRTSFANASIGDVLVYDSALSTADCDDVEAFFLAKYPGLA